MDLSKIVHPGYNRALLQSSEWSLQGTRGIRGGPWLHGDHLSIPGFCKQNFHLSEFSAPDFRHGARLGFIYRRSQRRCTSRGSSSRKDHGNIISLERLVRRTVKSEEEQEQKEQGMKEKQPKSVTISPTQTRLEVVVARARGVLTSARIFTSMMTWVILFFMASVWDGDSQSFNDHRNRNGKRGPRR